MKLKLFILSYLLVFINLNYWGQTFSNQISLSGLPTSNGVPIEVFDYDNDGYEDLVILQASTLKIFRNNHTLTFTDNTTTLGLPSLTLSFWAQSSTPIACFDYNNDGWKDIVICQTNSIRIFKNNCGMSFSEQTTALGVVNPITNTSTMLSFGTISDFDLDGDGDILFSRILSSSSRVVSVLRNNISSFSVIDLFVTSLTYSNSEAVQLRTIDYDGDQDDDLLFVNKRPKATYAAGSGYFSYQDINLYQNNGAGTYVNVTASSGLTEAFARNGGVVWDYNNDKKLDVLFGCDDGYVPTLSNPAKLFQSNGSTFTDVSGTKVLTTFPSNLPGYYWYTSIVDFDNDADFDAYQGKGFNAPSSYQLYQNSSGNFTESSSTYGLNISDNVLGGTGNNVWFDADNDGDLDSYIRTSTADYFMINPLNTNKFLNVIPVGCSANRDAIGAKVVVKTGGKYLTQFNGYSISSNIKSSDVFHYGLGSALIADSVWVYWPGSGISVLSNVTANQTLYIYQNPSCSSNNPIPIVTSIISNNLTCSTTSATLTGTSDGNSMVWNGGALTNIPNPAIVSAAGIYTVTATSAVNGCTNTSTVTITSNTTPPTVTSSSTTILCNGGSSTVTVNAMDGTAPYTGTGIFTASAGAYAYTVTDANGCSASTSGTITEPTLLSAAASAQTNVSCNGLSNGSATIAASAGTPGYTYSWSPSGGTGVTASALSAGSYTCTVTDANSCTAARTFNITQPAALSTTASAQTNVSCNGLSNGSATITASGGTPGYTYSWSPSGGTGVTASALSAGSYTCTVTDANSCTDAQSFVITQPNALMATSSSTAILCNSGSSTVTVNAMDGTAPYTGTGIFTASAGAYVYTVTDANGCSTSTTGTITEPSLLSAAASAQTNVSCNGLSNGSTTITASGGTPGYTYSWSPSGGTGATASAIAAGSYTCTVTDANSCSATQSFVITQPATLMATSSSTAILCNGGSSTVTVNAMDGTAPYTGTGIFTASAGSYAYTVTDANGCSASTNGTITEPAAITGMQSPSICVGENYQVGTSTYTTVGTYTDILTAANGCDSTVTTNLTVNPLPSLSVAAADTNVCISSSAVSLIALPLGGTWTGAGIVGSTFSPSVAGAGTHIITYTYTDINACANTAQITMVVDLCTGINVVSNIASLTVYPNPTNSTLTINTKAIYSSIQIVNTLGQLVFTREKSTSLNVSSLPSGIYFIQLVDNKGSIIGKEKFVKE